MSIIPTACTCQHPPEWHALDLATHVVSCIVLGCPCQYQEVLADLRPEDVHQDEDPDKDDDE